MRPRTMGVLSGAQPCPNHTYGVDSGLYRSRNSQYRINAGYIIVIVTIVAVVIAAIAAAIFIIFSGDRSGLPLPSGAVIGGGEEPDGVSTTLNIDATVEARVEQRLAAQPTPNIDAKVEARVRQKLAAHPTLIPQVIVKEVPVAIIEAVVREALAAAVATTAPPTRILAVNSLPSPTPIAAPTPTHVPTPIPTLAPTPIPVPTPMPTSIPTPTPRPGTKIGNMLVSQDTTWRKSGSPFFLEGEAQVLKGVTLTIEPGVTVIGSGGRISFAGTVMAEGKSSDKISFELTTAGIFDGQARTGILIVRHAIITGIGAKDTALGVGVSFITTQLFGGGMTAEIHDSIFRGIEYLVYPGPATVTAEHNIFRDSTQFRFTGNSSSLAVRYNCFNMPWPPVDVHTKDISSINFNSIYGVKTPISEEMRGNGFQAFGGSIDASENYWHGFSESDIQKTISDSTTNSTNPGVVDFLPLRTEPHPDTPDCS